MKGTQKNTCFTELSCAMLKYEQRLGSLLYFHTIVRQSNGKKIDDLGLRVGKEDDNRDAHTIRFNYCTAAQYPQPQTYGRSLNRLKVFFFAYDNIIFPC